MAGRKYFYDIDGFARLYINTRNIRSYKDIRTEELANLFRFAFGLGPFPALLEIWEICRELNIPIKDLPSGLDGLLGLNVWHASTGPEIYLKPDLPIQLGETTTGHELREVLETAFGRIRPGYVGLRTFSNEMDQESDQFAGCLLMKASATNERLSEIGFDLVRFASERERSLPSIVMRLRELYSSRSTYRGPVAGVWLFETPWEKALAQQTTVHDLIVRYDARMGGFSTDKSRHAAARLANLMLPARGMRADSFSAVRDACETRSPVVRDLDCFDLFDEHNYVLVVEPLFMGNAPWRVLVMAVRRDCLARVASWLERLGRTTRMAAPA